METECPHCGEPMEDNCICSAYRVITEGDDANYDCSLKEIKAGYNNLTKPKRKQYD